MRRGTTTTLILLFLFVETAGACSIKHHGTTTHCLFDTIMQKSGDFLPIAHERVIPSRNKNLINAYTASDEENEIWEPLRIKVSTKDLEEGGRQCNKLKINKVINDFEGKMCLCEGHSMLEQKDAEDLKSIFTKILVQAIKLHTDRLSVKRAYGKSIVLPPFTTGVCQYFTVPTDYFINGFKDADMILFVGSIPVAGAKTTAWAVPCAVNKEGRPVAGAINMFPTRPKFNRYAVRSAAHHIGHALGFSYNLMTNLRMMDQLQVRTKYNYVPIVKTKETKRVVQKHFNCPTAHGMELEDGTENNKMQSHWEKRNAKDELMSDFDIYSSESSLLGLYSELTLAAFNDMGFYKADFTKAEPMTWGKGAGCDFLETSCVDEKGSSKYSKMFCTMEQLRSCTSDRLSTGFCTEQDAELTINPYDFTKFVSLTRVKNENALTDYCPVIAMYGTSCGKLSSQYKSWGVDRITENSWCLDGNKLKIKLKDQLKDVGGVCAEVQCIKKENKFKIQLQGDEKWHECSENEEIDPKTEGTLFISGKVKCPKYDEVCTVNKDGESLVTGDDDLKNEKTSDKSEEQNQFIAEELESSSKKAEKNKNERKLLKKKSPSLLNKIPHRTPF